MNRYILITLLTLCCINVFGQSITINDLTNISNLPNDEAHKYVVLGKGFKQEYLQDVGSNTLEHLHKTGTDKKEESLIIGEGTKLSNGQLPINHKQRSTYSI